MRMFAPYLLLLIVSNIEHFQSNGSIHLLYTYCLKMNFETMNLASYAFYTPPMPFVVSRTRIAYLERCLTAMTDLA